MPGHGFQPVLEGLHLFEGLVFKVADGQERVRVLEFRRQVYQAELGYHGVDRFDEQAHHLIALDRHGEIVAASRMLGPDQRPFDIEQFIDISRIVPPARSPAQTGGMWVHPSHRAVSRRSFVPIGMLKLAYDFARKRGITDFVMYTYPRLQSIYRSAFFRRVDMTFKHPSWGEVCVMHLDLLAIEEKYSQSSGPTARLLFATDLPNFLV